MFIELADEIASYWLLIFTGTTSLNMCLTWFGHRRVSIDGDDMGVCPRLSRHLQLLHLADTIFG